MNSAIVQIKSGKVVDGSGIVSILKYLKDGQYRFTIKRFTGRKSMAQLGYLWAGIVARFAEQYGCDEAGAYALLMFHCNKKPVVNKKSGEIEYVPYTLSRIDKSEMCEVIDRCIRWAAESGYVIETAEEYLERKRIAGIEEWKSNNLQTERNKER